jgi:hypothetical protein
LEETYTHIYVYISHDNQKISIITILKSQSKIKYFLKSKKDFTKGFAKLGKKDKMNDKIRRKFTCNMNKNDGFSLVQGPSIIT